MSAPPPQVVSLTVAGRAARVALIGNPNTGKTSLFNALTGYRRHVANYPGVTVEVAQGPIRGAGPLRIDLLDLPGTYSLDAQSPDERIVAEVLSGQSLFTPRPDAILAVADATNLRRCLFLVDQAAQSGLPMILALNMSDIAARRGMRIDHDLLSQRLGIPVVPVVGTRSSTLELLRPAIESTLEQAGSCAPSAGNQSIADADSDSASAPARYARIDALLIGIISHTTPIGPTWSERIDSLVTNRVLGIPLLFAVLFIVFQAIFAWAAPLMEWIETGVAWLGGVIASVSPEGALRNLLVDGIIGGVGGVLVFIPQIAMLFALIAVLEDCGYMARAAFILDRTMRSVGLTGRAFIPLLSAFACAVPAIMGARTIADRRERFVTILLAPFMSCSARLPVYAVLIAAFVPATGWLGGWIGLQGVTLFAMYLVGALVAIPLAWLLRKSVFCGPPPAFLLELPSYKIPRVRAIWQRVSSAVGEFLYRAGTVILLVNVIVWALGYFPRSSRVAGQVAANAAAAHWTPGRTEHELRSAYQRDSYLGRLGRWVEPAVQPLGWDWRIAMATIASFPAREVVLGTLGTIFAAGADPPPLGRDDGRAAIGSNAADTAADSAADEVSDTGRLRTVLRQARREDGRPLFTLPVALSLMVFFALCAQCSSTLVVIGRETRSWKWPVLSFVGMTMIAYVAAMTTYQLARLITAA